MYISHCGIMAQKHGKIYSEHTGAYIWSTGGTGFYTGGGPKVDKNMGKYIVNIQGRIYDLQGRTGYSTAGGPRVDKNMGKYIVNIQGRIYDIQGRRTGFSTGGGLKKDKNT